MAYKIYYCSFTDVELLHTKTEIDDFCKLKIQKMLTEGYINSSKKYLKLINEGNSEQLLDFICNTYGWTCNKIFID